MKDVTLILQRIQDGQAAASEDLFPIVYDELRRLAADKMSQERVDHTLSSTALVHEAYVRLVDTDKVSQWDSRGHFFSAAAEAMRRILVEHARKKSAAKRGGQLQREALVGDPTALPDDPDVLLDLNDALERLEQTDTQAAALFKLLLFAGMSVAEAGRMLDMSPKSARRNWDYIRSWCAIHLDGENP